MNNRGQSLVLFILIVPILLGVMVLVFDVGNALYEKNKINNAIELVLELGLEDEYTEEEFEELLTYNFSGNYKVDIKDDKVIIVVEDYVDGIISNIVDVDGFLVVSEYVGYVKNDKKIIEKVR